LIAEIRIGIPDVWAIVVVNTSKWLTIAELIAASE